jgi:hypothetical protein
MVAAVKLGRPADTKEDCYDTDTIICILMLL